MYTVLRFSSDDGELLRSGALMLDEIRPGFFDGMDRIGGRFSCSVQDSPIWEEHLSKMTEALTIFGSAIESLKANGVEIEFDIAIETGDLGSRLYTSFDLDSNLLKTLSNMGIGITLTFYQTEKPE